MMLPVFDDSQLAGQTIEAEADRTARGLEQRLKRMCGS